MSYREKLDEISKTIDRGIVPQSVSARTFIGWFGAQRRSTWNVEYIRSGLKEYKLVTDPDFQFVWIDSSINFKRAPQRNKRESEEPLEVKNDPTYRIGKLASANNPPISVAPDDILEKALTIMVAQDFSQLPIMTSNREVKGVITWKSMASHLALGTSCTYVRDCLEPHKEISYDAYIFDAIQDIVLNDYVLVRGSDHIICGIVTTADMSQQFRNLGEPYLLLGEIENYLRKMLKGKFTRPQLQAACFEADRKIEEISDLTLGEYIRLLENPQNWKKLGVNVERQTFIKKLDGIRNIRNDVMHFDPDGLGDDALMQLRDFVRLLQSLAKCGAI